MSPNKTHKLAQLCLLFFVATKAQAVTLTAGQTDYTTPSDITTSGSGIISSLSGTSANPNKITNTYTITTGNSGATTSAYGIRSSGIYNQITNDIGAAIFTTGNSGRGVSVDDFSSVNNSGSISTQGTTSYGIYAGGTDISVVNSGSISTLNTTSYGIYSNGNNNSLSNSGAITTTGGSTAYGIYVSAGTSSAATSNNHSSVDNSGIILSNSHGIYTKDNYTEITNSGTITPASGTSIYGIRAEGDNSIITNSGNITASKYAIYNSGENSVINNSGNLYGGVRLGTALLNITGGSISGEVDGISQSGSVAISDGVIFNQNAAFIDLDSLTINSGAIINSNNSINANNIFIGQNAVLNLNENSSLSAAISGLNNSQGTLNISGISFVSANSIGSLGNSLANLNINSGSALTASNDIYADNISVNGTLNFNAANNLTIFGNVSGSGAGIIDVGANSQNINGNFSLNSGDILRVSLANSNVGNLNISGEANIDANSILQVTTNSNQGYIADNTKLTLINSANVNQIADENIKVGTSNSNVNGLLRFSTESTSQGLVLAINHLKAEEITQNKNSQNIYQNLNLIGASSGGKLLEFQEYLFSNNFSNNAEITETLNQVAPQSSKASLAVSSNIVSNSLITAETRLEKTRHNLEHGFWVQSFGLSGSQQQVQNDASYNSNSVGLALGLDKEISNSATIGAALSYTRSNVKFLNNSKNLITSNQINFYGSHNFEKYFLDFFAAASINQYDSNRIIEAVSSNATAKYTGQTYAAKIKIGRVKNLHHDFIFTPELALNFLHNNIGTYSEKGADSLNLNVSSVSANFLESRAGLNLSWITKNFEEFPEFDKMLLSGKISYGYAFINDAPNTKASFSGQTTNFNTRISQIDRGSLKLGATIDAYHLEQTIFSSEYIFEKRSTYQGHFFALKIKQRF